MRIAYMPRRGGQDAEQVFELLRARGALVGWDVVPLDRLAHDHVARELRKATIFLAFTHQEGFGLPAAEAMACGCYVIGNHGLAGREFLSVRLRGRWKRATSSHLRARSSTRSKSERRDPHWCRTRGLAAAAFVAREYPHAREREDVTGIYTAWLGAESVRQTAKTRKHVVSREPSQSFVR